MAYKVHGTPAPSSGRCPVNRNIPVKCISCSLSLLPFFLVLFLRVLSYQTFSDVDKYEKNERHLSLGLAIL